MRKVLRRTILFLVFFALILGGYLFVRLRAASRVQIPDAFSSSRSEGAVIAQNIVNLSNEVASDLQKINDLDKNRRYKEANALAKEDEQKVSDIRTRSIQLSEELKKMTSALPDISPADAKQAALDSITNRMALISRLISYTDKVNHLLGVLETHFETGQEPTEDVTQLVSDINGEVRAINTFNSQAGQAMDRLDKIGK